MAGRKGKCWVVGVGPGDPELLTIKAARIIEQCPVVASPKSRQAKTVALDIARKAVDLSQKEIVLLRFPMTYSYEERETAHTAAADEVGKYLDDGLDVAMLTLGDPSIYTTASYVADLLTKLGYETEVVPGVPSFCASASAVQTILAQDEELLTIIPAAAGEEELNAALDCPGTKVIMKSGRKIPEVLELLRRRDLLGQTTFAENVGLPGEQTGPASDLEGRQPGYFTTLIVTDRE